MTTTSRVNSRRKLHEFQGRSEQYKHNFIELQQKSNLQYEQRAIIEKERELKRYQQTVDYLLEQNHKVRAEQNQKVVYIKKNRDILSKLADVLAIVIFMMIIYWMLMGMSLFFRYLGSLPF